MKDPEPTPSLEAKLSRATVSEVMTRSVTCVDSELDLDVLAQIFENRGIRAAPVVEDRGVILGMVSMTDLVRGLRAQRAQALRTHDPRVSDELLVEDIMTASAVTLAETASLTEALTLMAARDLHRVPVVTQSGAVVGFLSVIDLMRWLARALTS